MTPSCLLLVGLRVPLLKYKIIARDALVYVLDIVHNSLEVRSGII